MPTAPNRAQHEAEPTDRSTPADPATGGPRVWTAQDGSTRASFEVSAGTVRFLSSRAETEGGGTGSAPVADEGNAPTNEEDIPF